MVQQNQLNRFAIRAFVLLLLIGVAGVRIVAKANSRLPKSNPAHFISAATKMEPTQPLTVSDGTPLHTVSSLAPPAPTPQAVGHNDTDLPPIKQIVLTPSSQHRPPPAFA